MISWNLRKKKESIFCIRREVFFTRYWCFRKRVRRYPSIFLIMLSPTMNNDVLYFWGLVGFWDGGCDLPVFLSEDRFFLFITWLISFVFENATSVLVKCIVSSDCAWVTLSSVKNSYFTNSRMLISNTTIVFLKFQLKNTQIKHF